MSSFSDLDEIVVSDNVGFPQSLTPIPKENVVVPHFRILPNAELTEDDSTRAEPKDDEKEEDACGESTIAQRHAPFEILERRQIFRLRNFTIAMLILSLQQHRDSYAPLYEKWAASHRSEASRPRAVGSKQYVNKPMNPSSLTPLPPAPNNHHLFEALPEPAKQDLLNALKEQLVGLTYCSELRPDSETSWEAMGARCEAHEEEERKRAKKLAKEEKEKNHPKEKKRKSSRSSDRSEETKKERKRPRRSVVTTGSSNAEDSDSSVSTPTSSATRLSSLSEDSSLPVLRYSGTSPLRQKQLPKPLSAMVAEANVQRPQFSRSPAPPPLKRMHYDDATHVVECPPEVLSSLAVPGISESEPWLMLKLRSQMHPSTHRPRNVVYMHCSYRPPPAAAISPRRRSVISPELKHESTPSPQPSSPEK